MIRWVLTVACAIRMQRRTLGLASNHNPTLFPITQQSPSTSPPICLPPGHLVLSRLPSLCRLSSSVIFFFARNLSSSLSSLALNVVLLLFSLLLLLLLLPSSPVSIWLCRAVIMRVQSEGQKKKNNLHPARRTDGSSGCHYGRGGS